MKRKIIRIDEELCNGCGNCVPNCHEGALQIIDGKARLISDLMCDGLGACLGHCPEGAITVEEREAEEYNETEVMKGMIPNGKNTLIAHFTHLLDHEQDEYFKEGISYLFDRKDELAFDVQEVIEGIRNHVDSKSCGCSGHSNHPGGCPGSQEQSFEKNTKSTDLISSDSQLTHWPIQLHLINPSSAHFKNCDLLVAADCTAFSIGNFHPDYLKGRKLIIACPKLDDGQDSYLEKIRKLIAVAHVNTITVMRMEVPCCFSLVQMVKHAIDETGAKVPLKEIVVGTTGEIVSSNWI
ncbi:MAG: 4Fe-4S binding protein [Bacteroidales bacterium]|jgi:NAD-dependent dihydropyrimidine dehydrogenase PreA subunit|nr:4Fe-4S binding protein [Bacteroidales bacterium]HOY39815.1 4Fe-4S binding protein [Bacteroidales bacterium]HQP05110.1 4Fe-4S binding protein [Bacteroidales bacterium]